MKHLYLTTLVFLISLQVSVCFAQSEPVSIPVAPQALPPVVPQPLSPKCIEAIVLHNTSLNTINDLRPQILEAQEFINTVSFNPITVLSTKPEVQSKLFGYRKNYATAEKELDRALLMIANHCDKDKLDVFSDEVKAQIAAYLEAQLKAFTPLDTQQ